MSIARCLIITLISTTVLHAQDSTYHAQVVEAWQAINKYYHDAKFDTIAWQKIRRALYGKPFLTPEAAQAAIASMVAGVKSPTLRQMTGDQLQLFSKEISGEACWGTGLIELLCVDIGAKSNLPQVISILEGTPAQRVGLKPGDIITHINTTNTQGLNLTQLYALIRQPGAPSVSFTVLRRKQKLNIVVPNATIPAIDKSVDYQIKQAAGKRFAHIRLRIFIGNTSQQFKAALAAADSQAVDGIVLDLRNNPGGNVKSCLEAAGMLLGEKPIARMKSNNGSTTINATGPKLTDLPVSVVVNSATASAAEVLAGALQYYKRGVVFGEATIGKGLVHKAVKLTDGSVLFMATASFQHLNGIDILINGIKPDKPESGDRVVQSAAMVF
jgi:carboxyl-terminal processing protease